MYKFKNAKKIKYIISTNTFFSFKKFKKKMVILKKHTKLTVATKSQPSRAVKSSQNKTIVDLPKRGRPLKRKNNGSDSEDDDFDFQEENELKKQHLNILKIGDENFDLNFLNEKNVFVEIIYFIFFAFLNLYIYCRINLTKKSKKSNKGKAFII